MDNPIIKPQSTNNTIFQNFKRSSLINRNNSCSNKFRLILAHYHQKRNFEIKQRQVKRSKQAKLKSSLSKQNQNKSETNLKIIQQDLTMDQANVQQIQSSQHKQKIYIIGNKNQIDIDTKGKNTFRSRNFRTQTLHGSTHLYQRTSISYKKNQQLETNNISRYSHNPDIANIQYKITHIQLKLDNIHPECINKRVKNYSINISKKKLKASQMQNKPYIKKKNSLKSSLYPQGFHLTLSPNNLRKTMKDKQYKPNITFSQKNKIELCKNQQLLPLQNKIATIQPWKEIIQNQQFQNENFELFSDTLY